MRFLSLLFLLSACRPSVPNHVDTAAPPTEEPEEGGQSNR
jgi:hypothetical protein